MGNSDHPHSSAAGRAMLFFPEPHSSIPRTNTQLRPCHFFQTSRQSRRGHIMSLRRTTKVVAVFVCAVLCVSMTIAMTGCGDDSCLPSSGRVRFLGLSWAPINLGVVQGYALGLLACASRQRKRTCLAGSNRLFPCDSQGFFRISSWIERGGTRRQTV